MAKRGQIGTETSLESLGPPPIRGHTSHRVPRTDASGQESRGQDWGANFAGGWAPLGGTRSHHRLHVNKKEGTGKGSPCFLQGPSSTIFLLWWDR